MWVKRMNLPTYGRWPLEIVFFLAASKAHRRNKWHSHRKYPKFVRFPSCQTAIPGRKQGPGQPTLSRMETAVRITWPSPSLGQLFIRRPAMSSSFLPFFLFPFLASSFPFDCFILSFLLPFLYNFFLPFRLFFFFFLSSSFPLPSTLFLHPLFRLFVYFLPSFLSSPPPPFSRATKPTEPLAILSSLPPPHPQIWPDPAAGWLR